MKKIIVLLLLVFVVSAGFAKQGIPINFAAGNIKKTMKM